MVGKPGGRSGRGAVQQGQLQGQGVGDAAAGDDHPDRVLISSNGRRSGVGDTERFTGSGGGRSGEGDTLRGDEVDLTAGREVRARRQHEAYRIGGAGG